MIIWVNYNSLTEINPHNKQSKTNQMNTSVTVTASESGAVIIQSPKNPIYGYIRLEQQRSTVNEGWLETKNLSALIRGTVKNLRSEGYTKGQSLPGKIQIKEQMEPFNRMSPQRDYKMAGESGVVCSFEGNPIYRNCFYTDDMHAPDILVVHDNNNEIMSKLSEQKEDSQRDATL